MDFPRKGEGTDHICIVYLKKTDIHESEAGKSPTGFEDNLLVLLGTLQMKWQRRVCVISKDSTNGFKNCHTKVEHCSLIYLFL